MNDAFVQWLPALAHALWTFIWQGALIGVIAAVALHLSRRAAPQWRYAIAAFALAACPIVFVLTLLLASAAPDSGVLARTLVAMRRVSGDASTTWIVSLWLAGVATLLLRLFVGLAEIRRVRLAGTLSAHWQHRTQVLAGVLGFARAVELRLVETLDSPICFGWFKPVVLMPIALLTRLPADQIEALIAHELAHLRAHDYLVNLLQHVVEALLFFHPVVWWLSHRMRHERELIADQIAATATASPRSLAHALAALAEWRADDALPRMALSAARGELKARVRALLAGNRDTARVAPSRPPFISAPVLAAVAALVAILPLQATVSAQATKGSRVVHAESAPLATAIASPSRSTISIERHAERTPQSISTIVRERTRAAASQSMPTIVLERTTAAAPPPTSSMTREQQEDALQSLRERIEDQQAQHQERLESEMHTHIERWESVSNEIAELWESVDLEASPRIVVEAKERYAALKRESEVLEQEMRQLRRDHERDMRALRARYEALRE